MKPHEALFMLSILESPRLRSADSQAEWVILAKGMLIIKPNINITFKKTQQYDYFIEW